MGDSASEFLAFENESFLRGLRVVFRFQTSIGKDGSLTKSAVWLFPFSNKVAVTTTPFNEHGHFIHYYFIQSQLFESLYVYIPKEGGTEERHTVWSMAVSKSEFNQVFRLS